VTERLRVTTLDGKYTVIQEQDGRLSFLRDDEPWPEADHFYTRSKIILTLAQDLATLLAERREERTQPDAEERTLALHDAEDDQSKHDALHAFLEGVDWESGDEGIFVYQTLHVGVGDTIVRRGENVFVRRKK
jgi:hypothetical protein